MKWTFQFLIGILKSYYVLFRFISWYWVSIPYRYSKICLCNQWLYDVYSVSIPYRYSKICNGLTYQVQLIVVSIPYRYSKIWIRWYAYRPAEWFQFLIGILKSFKIEEDITKISLVSIPYRYSKISLSSGFCSFIFSGFNSL